MQTPQAPVAAAVARHWALCAVAGDRGLALLPITNGVLQRAIASAWTLAVGALLVSSQAAAQAQRLIVDAPDPRWPTRTDVEAARPGIADRLQRELALSILRALHGVSCVHGRDGDRFAFEIRFDPDADARTDPAPPQRMAQRRAP